MKNTKANLKRMAYLWLGLEVEEWTPGDGATRYTFVLHGPTRHVTSGRTQVGLTQVGLKAAWIHLDGLLAGAKLQGDWGSNEAWTPRNDYYPR